MSTHKLILRVVALAVLIGGGVLLWKPLLSWFSGNPDGPVAAEPQVTRAQKGAPPPQIQLPAAALEYSRSAFQALEKVRALLAADKVVGLKPRADEVAALLRSAVEVPGTPPAAAESLRSGSESADRLAAAKSPEEAREHFASLSQALMALASAEPRLQEGWHVFQCPMAQGFDKWFQRAPQMQNPYMGLRMLACGSPSTWEAAQQTGSASKGPISSAEIAHYTCPMHPSVKSAQPGACPICGMDLTPVTRDELESGVIRVDDERRRQIGLKTSAVTVAPIDLSFRALGRVAYDETALKDVTLKLDGYIHSLRVDATGQAVKKGDVLFTLYSPELYAAQQEYLLARNSQSEANASLARASRKRLELWGLTSAQLDHIAEGGEPMENVPFLSPASGFVIEKNVVEGAAVKAGERLFRVAPLQTVWVEAEVYEQNLPQVKVGQPVEVTLPYLPNQRFPGKVAFILPALDPKTRTGKIRIELPNPGFLLKPDMYAAVRFEMESKPVLQVPESAVIYTGPRRLVFVDLGEGQLRPQEVQLGMQGEAGYEVLAGLKEGDRVVTSGNFLIAAESRIRSATDQWNGSADDAR